MARLKTFLERAFNTQESARIPRVEITRADNERFWKALNCREYVLIRTCQEFHGSVASRISKQASCIQVYLKRKILDCQHPDSTMRFSSLQSVFFCSKRLAEEKRWFSRTYTGNAAATAHFLWNLHSLHRALIRSASDSDLIWKQRAIFWPHMCRML